MMSTVEPANVRTIHLGCNQCGAPLEVRDDTNYLVCIHCTAHLEVIREGGAVFTTIRELLARTERNEENVARIEARETLDRLDRSWERRLAQYEDAAGRVIEPSAGGALFGIAFAATVGGFMTLVALLSRQYVAAAVVVFIAVCYCTGMSFRWRAAEYFRRDRRDYHRQREVLTQTLDEYADEREA